MVAIIYKTFSFLLDNISQSLILAIPSKEFINLDNIFGVYSKVKKNYLAKLLNMLSEDAFYARLVREAEILRREYPTFKPVEGRSDYYRGFIVGTGIYKGGYFCLEIRVPRNYPFKPPEVTWKTPIYHPNFFKNRVCIGILKKDWTPSFNLVEAIRGIHLLLSNPNPHDPMNRSAADHYLRDIDDFKLEAIRWVEMYAGKDQECLQ